MHYYITLLAVALTATADSQANSEKCITLVNTHKHCCKEPTFNKTSILDDDIKECTLMPSIPGSCDKALCFATKLGFATADGIIKMDKLQKHMEQKLSDHEDILAAVKDECLDDGYKSYGEPDDCDLEKIKNCVIWQYIFRCPDFSNEETCKEFKEMAETCLELDS